MIRLLAVILTPLFLCCSVCELQQRPMSRASDVSRGHDQRSPALRHLRDALWGRSRGPRRWGQGRFWRPHLWHQQPDVPVVVSHDPGRVRHGVRDRHQAPGQLHHLRSGIIFGSRGPAPGRWVSIYTVPSV